MNTEGIFILFYYIYFVSLGRKSRNNINLLNPIGHVMHQQFNIQQLYALPTLYLCVFFI